MYNIYLKHYKNLIAAISFLLVHNFLPAQDIDRKKTDIPYIVLPLKGLPQDIETYAVKYKSKQTSWGNSLGNVYDAEKIKINGYYQLPAADDADLVIEGEVATALIFDQAYAEAIEKTYKKDKNSPEVKYTAWVYKIYYYTPKILCRAFSKNGTTIFDGYYGGTQTYFQYGDTDYDSYFASESTLSRAWANAKAGELLRKEKEDYEEVFKLFKSNVFTYGMYPAVVTFTAKYVDDKKGKTLYEDTRVALDYFLQAVAAMGTDNIAYINKLIQPDFVKRKELMGKAIEIWEKCLAEADFENKKARIDAKVGRHIYFNLALAYMIIEDFTKAKEYAQGRKKDLGSWDKNFLSGIRDLSREIDDRVARQEANKWRKFMAADSNAYVYKDPAQRKKEADLVQAIRQKFVSDSLAMEAKTKAAAKKQPVKKGTKPVVKTPAKKPAAAKAKS